MINKMQLNGILIKQEKDCPGKYLLVDWLFYCIHFVVSNISLIALQKSDLWHY